MTTLCVIDEILRGDEYRGADTRLPCDPGIPGGEELHSSDRIP